jgi:hypothetical protein
MLRAMKKALFGVALAVFACSACGGGGKDAASPGECPEGTVLKGSDCLPSDSAGDGDSTPKKKKKMSDDDAEKSLSSGGGDSSPSGGGGGSSGGTPYDKENVEAQMRKTAKQIKANCGAATDEEGQKTGPWGTVHVSIVLGRNGRVKQVGVPAPYDGKPVGVCMSRALMKIVFPPYAGSDDVSIEWDFELVKPK